MGGQSRGRLGCDPGIESSRVVGSACSCLPGEDSDGSGDARVASAVRNKPPILVGMPEKVVNNSYAPDFYPCILMLLDPTDHTGNMVREIKSRRGN